MIFSDKHISLFKQLLKEGKSIHDLSKIINLVIRIQNDNYLKKNIKDSEKHQKITDNENNDILKTPYRYVSSKRLGYYLAKRDDKYEHFTIPKKSGGFRQISSPDKFLKKIQRRLGMVLESLFMPRTAANGFVKDRSIQSNAKGHIGKQFVYNVDIKNFFPTINYGRIKAVLQLPPINASKDMAHYISHLACHKGVLPQGSPLSPLLTNLVCQILDYKLVKLAKQYGCFYSRYADDITFSSHKYFTHDKFLNQLNNIITKQGFQLNPKKTRLQNKHQRQEVTGITVNEKLNLQRKYLKEIRAMLYNWEHKGLDYSQNKLNAIYPNHKGFLRNEGTPSFINTLQGRIHFVSMVRGKNDPYVVELINKFDRLKKT